MRGRLPFALLSVDSDNDSAFINVLMQGYCQQEGIAFGRSRPYRKSDQAHIEQRNWSLVRQDIGYDRYKGDATAAFNALWVRNHSYALGFSEKEQAIIAKGSNFLTRDYLLFVLGFMKARLSRPATSLGLWCLS